ncbi:MAG: GHKL domain-containing protein, partial [Firmicutes bacterium]|nr:GHKL domain-containing protein [Bacillota bacterium]
VGELTAGLAHEIRNPLGLIKNYLFLLKKKITGEKENHAVEVMDDSVTSAMDLEKDTMDKRNIGLELDFGNAAGKKLKINDDVLKLCLINLTKNSLDAFEECDKETKHIRLKFSKASGRLKMDFEDNASGIPRDKLDQIFDPFFTTKDNGTGLGLYILQSEVMKIGGNLTVESVPGEGTVFHLELPIEEEMKDERK